MILDIASVIIGLAILALIAWGIVTSPFNNGDWP